MDKEWLTVDNWPGSPFIRSVYVTFTNFRPDRSVIQLARSRDLGQTFANPITLSPDQANAAAQFSQVAVGQGGEVFVTFWWSGDGGANPPGHYFVKSTDGGATSSAPMLVVPTSKPGHFNAVSGRFELNGFVRVAEIATLAVDAGSGSNGGDLHLVVTSHGNGTDEVDILYARSEDGGHLVRPDPAQ